MPGRRPRRLGAAVASACLGLRVAAGAAELPEADLRGANLPTGSLGFPTGSVNLPTGGLDLPSGGLNLPSYGMARPVTSGTEMRFQLSSDVLFDFDKAELRPEAEAVLRQLLAEVRAKVRKPRFRVEGHTDARGADDYNPELSRHRAESVRGWLTRVGGIPGASAAAVGFGEARPVAPNENPDGSDNPEGRQKNRRVEVVVTGS